MVVAIRTIVVMKTTTMTPIESSPLRSNMARKEPGAYAPLTSAASFLVARFGTVRW